MKDRSTLPVRAFGAAGVSRVVPCSNGGSIDAAREGIRRPRGWKARAARASLAGAACLALAACDKPPVQVERSFPPQLAVSPVAMELGVGSKARIAALATGRPPYRALTWTVNDPGVAELDQANDNFALVVAKVPGRTEVVVTLRDLPSVHQAVTIVVDSVAPAVLAHTLTYSGAASLDAGVVAGTFAIGNGGSALLRLQVVTICGPALRLFRTADRSGSPAWDQGAWFAARPGGCKGTWVLVDVGAGQVQTFRTSARVTDILGDSLPPGRYYPTIRMAVADGFVQSLDLDAGMLDIR